MLYAHHFDGGHLNNLGRSKVMLMLQDCESCEPITVHLVSCGEGEQLAQRKAAVELYLKTTEGPNKLTFHPAEADIIRAKTATGGSDAARSRRSGSPSGGNGGGRPAGGGSDINAQRTRVSSGVETRAKNAHERAANRPAMFAFAPSPLRERAESEGRA
jgi:hypothetical protein